jgi:hypothetical protein
MNWISSIALGADFKKYNVGSLLQTLIAAGSAIRTAASLAAASASTASQGAVSSAR